MVWKIFRAEIRIPQLLSALFASIFGITLLTLAVLFYIDTRQIFADREGFWTDEYVVINKQVHLSDTYRQLRHSRAETPVFSEEEIEHILQLPYVSDVAPFTASTFSVSLYIDETGPMSGFYTDLFLEAVPDKYLDVESADWQWKEDGDVLPIIIPRSYLNLYNFGFAQSQGLPQLAESAFAAIDFNVAISGKGMREVHKARVVGLSNRINSVLVPLQFINDANRRMGTTQLPSPGRLIVVANDPSNPELLEFFKQNDYHPEGDVMDSASARVLLRTITLIVLAIGAIITMLSLWFMLFSILLMLERNRTNIVSLSKLGYTLKQLYSPFNSLLLILLITAFLLSVIPVLSIRKFYAASLELIGYSLSVESVFIAQLPVLLILVALWGTIVFFVRKAIFSIMV